MQEGVRISSETKPDEQVLFGQNLFRQGARKVLSAVERRPCTLYGPDRRTVSENLISLPPGRPS